MKKRAVDLIGTEDWLRGTDEPGNRLRFDAERFDDGLVVINTEFAKFVVPDEQVFYIELA